MFISWSFDFRSFRHSRTGSAPSPLLLPLSHPLCVDDGSAHSISLHDPLTSTAAKQVDRQSFVSSRSVTPTQSLLNQAPTHLPSDLVTRLLS